MANVTYRFTAGTKAVAEQVNTNFTDCINAINLNISSIETINGQLENLENSSANVNGNASERFSVADPVLNSDAVNKKYLENAITPILDYINGLVITKSSNTEIVISAGSCYDSTQKEILSLSSSYTASYSSTLSASTTYDVFIRKSKSTSSVDCAILAHETVPSSSDYYYRKIGEVITNSSAYISQIIYYSNSNVQHKTYPDYSRAISVSTNWTAPDNGVLLATCNLIGYHGASLYIDGTRVCYNFNNEPTDGDAFTHQVYIAKGQKITQIEAYSVSFTAFV